MKACIAITTYNRPAMLLEALRSVRAQQLPAGVVAEVLVVDNSRDANARAAVLAEAGAPGLPTRYVSAPEPNISVARNAAVAACDADWLVFLDDDEVAGPGWLAALLATADATGADVVFGGVLPAFPDGRPDWDPEGRSLARDIALPSGSTIGLHHDQRLSGAWIGTGNCLLRVATCFAGGREPFDLSLGRSGGEDYDFFVRLDAAGRRFVWCGDAAVQEVVPSSRLTNAYRRGRSFRTGQLYARITVRHARSRLVGTASLAFRAAVQLVLVTGLWSVSRLRGAPDAGTREMKMAEVAGKLLWGTRPRDRA
ncbi:glycosyltransferase family 2 protein [Roseomonas sp. KE2513]|uniref:glycosyltransferase family 2 protein n=1 Tax=Roseomonas sp. KE2513 TaxID=2479202 RepID=UPI0018E040FF|nr:glycosyltransferase family 2 protein [Roseomonas sp. KE2513]MBI0539064.1 glycosyltransferase family 2 protein [Roseomonas sp. KE2513]